jgi:hypothetical protein
MMLSCRLVFDDQYTEISCSFSNSCFPPLDVELGFLSFHILGFDKWAKAFCVVECEVQATNGRSFH